MEYVFGVLAVIVVAFFWLISAAGDSVTMTLRNDPTFKALRGHTLTDAEWQELTTPPQPL